MTDARARQLADELTTAATERAATLVADRARREELDLADDDRLLIEVGVAAGIAATLIELRDRGALGGWQP